jgi:putative redox protein
MVRITLRYPGELHTEAVHEPSSARLETDAPRDNHGKGESFSPTDLLATSLGACMMTVMGILARKEGLDIDGLLATVDKYMTVSPPRRVARLVVEVTLPIDQGARLDASQRAALEAAGETCPVRLSLSESVAVETSYRWDGPRPT